MDSCTDGTPVDVKKDPATNALSTTEKQNSYAR
jgi:hypothetical protein